MAKRHVVLAGLPGAGKTTAGRLAAALIDAPFTDLDELIAARAGKSVARIFAEDGEKAFRAIEKAVGGDTLRGPPCVFAPGGGFIMDAGLRRAAKASGLLIYLETSPANAAVRLEGQETRPLLEGHDPAARLTELLDEREYAYLEAEATVTTDGRTPEAVAAKVAELARSRGGW